MAGDESEFFDCPYLGTSVELTAERRAHIEDAHPADAARIIQHLRGTIEASEAQFASIDEAGVYLLAKGIEMPTGSKHIAAIIVSDEGSNRRWIVTAFVTRRLGGYRWTAI